MPHPAILLPPLHTNIFATTKYRRLLPRNHSERLLNDSPSLNFPQVDRFENLVNQLGLAGQVIDYVKLDVELSEVDFLQDMLLNSPHVLRNIKQIAMEVHDDFFKGDLSPTSRQQVFWPYFMLLKCQDFRLVHSRSNHGRWQEVVWGLEVDW
nr:uncharacterized protein LOC123750562 [Procambarus clarkii]